LAGACVSYASCVDCFSYVACVGWAPRFMHQYRMRVEVRVMRSRTFQAFLTHYKAEGLAAPGPGCLALTVPGTLLLLTSVNHRRRRLV